MDKFKILIMGLPGSGKTTLAAAISAELLFNCKVAWFNGDAVREKFNDWDFSIEGRIRQSVRMRELADAEDADFVICDFVAPLKVMRDNFAADCVVWMDTIPESKYADTNAIFEPPDEYDFRITEQDADKWAVDILTSITSA